MTTNVIKNTEIITNTLKDCLNLINEKRESIENVDETENSFLSYINEEYLSLEAIRSIKEFWNKYSNSEKILYIHELLANNNLYLPKYEPPKKDPDYDFRMQKLKAQIEEEDYQRMVSNVNLDSPYRESRSNKARFVPEFKTLQGQIVSILNVVLVVGGAFMFGYKAVEYSLGQPDIIKQMFGGLILALIVAAADLYFLIKKLFELDNSSKTKKTNISISSLKQEFSNISTSTDTNINKPRREKKND